MEPHTRDSNSWILNEETNMDTEIKIDSEDLRVILKSLSFITNEGIVSFTNDGINMKLVDPANVSMVDLTIPAADFIQYNIETEFELGLAFDKTLDFISSAKNTPVSLEPTNSKLEIKFDNAWFTQSTIPTKLLRAQPKIPVFEYDVKIELQTKLFAKGIKACAKIADHITFTMIKDIFTLSAKSNTDSVSAKIENPLIHKSNTAFSLYSVDYLSDLIKGIVHSNEVTVEMSMDFPLTIKTGICKTGTLVYILAPRIESD